MFKKAYLLPPLCSPYLQIWLNTSMSAASPCPLTKSTHSTSTPNHHTITIGTVASDNSKRLSQLLGWNAQPASIEHPYTGTEQAASNSLVTTPETEDGASKGGCVVLEVWATLCKLRNSVLTKIEL